MVPARRNLANTEFTLNSMRAKLEHIDSKGLNHSFLCYEIVLPSFKFLWHHHPEYELTYIQKGKGKRFVGDHIESFTAGDLVLLGSQLPHTWVSDGKGKEQCRAVVLQFSQEFIESLLNYPEMAELNRIFEKSKSGLQFRLKKQSSAPQLMESLPTSSGLQRIQIFIKLFDSLLLEKTKLLSSPVYQHLIKVGKTEKRINKVFQYINKAYSGTLSIHGAAGLIHLSESAFCKFFRRASGKTFSDYVNDVRIAQVCTQLIETDDPVSAIAYSCGFENLAYFNRVFLKKKKMQPGNYRKTCLIKLKEK
jgi:AraC-like DNA-binding protein/uncharacterized cupin superfamily protein